MLSINPLTAYKLLTSFSTLNKGDWVIQNAANSAVGRWVIYLANQLQLHTVNIVRREALVDDLRTLGAQEVIVEHNRFSQSVPQKGRCKLALNGVGGASAKEIAKCLDYKGHLVTYGAMAKEPLTFGNALFIFNTITASGFNRTHWIQEIERSAVQTIYNQLFDWLNDTPFQIPIHQCFDFTSIDEALQNCTRTVFKWKSVVAI